MGLLLEFYIGDKDAIVSAISESDFDALETGIVKSKADISLHISPTDLDLLSNAMGRCVGLEPMDLLPNMTGLVDEPEYGVLEVSRNWIAYAASVTDERIHDVTSDWAKAMSAEHGEEIDANEGLEAA